MSGANQSNHSLMYKSKSGHHLNAFKERLNGDKKQNRVDRRFESFQRNRMVEPTPQRVIDTATDANVGNFPTVSVDGSVRIANDDQKKLSKQQVFKQRFADYLKNKEAAKVKNAVRLKPFVSAVPSGKIVDVVKRKANPPPKKTNLEVLNPIPICDTPNHRSPINTRSKKLKLVPMEQLTPKRNKRKSINIRRNNIQAKPKVATLSRPGTSGRRLSITKNSRAKITNNNRSTSGAIKKVLKVTQPPKVVVKPKVAIKTTTTSVKATAAKKATPVASNTKNVLSKNRLQPKVTVKSAITLASPYKKALSPKPCTSKQAETKMNPLGPVVQFMKSPKIPARFKFGPSSFNGGVASTAVKPKVKPNSTCSPKSLFDDSVSPIGDESEATPKSSSSKRQSRIHKTPKPVPAIDEKFVSPFVKIARKLPTVTVSNDASDATTKDNGNVSTPTQNDKAVSNIVNYVSPFVTLSRGKRRFSAKEEAEARETKYKLESRKSLDLNESVTDRQHKEAAAYFRLQVQKETERFEALCDKWTKYIEENKGTDKLPEDNIDQIDVAIGQTKLLLRSKFKQFSTLVDQCADRNFTPKVKPQDLEGFWSLVGIQIERLSDRFDKLSHLEQNQWQDPSIEPVKVKKIRNAGITKTKPQAKRQIRSALTQLLNVARKNQNEMKNNGTASDEMNCIMFLNKRKSILNTSNLNDSKIRRTMTPSKIPWTVSIT